MFCFLLLIKFKPVLSTLFNQINFYVGIILGLQKSCKDGTRGFCMPPTQFVSPMLIIILHYCSTFIKTKKPPLVCYNSRLYSDFAFPLISFFCSTAQSRMSNAFRCRVSFVSGLWLFLTLCFYDLDCFREYWSSIL